MFSKYLKLQMIFRISLSAFLCLLIISPIFLNPFKCSAVSENPICNGSNISCTGGDAPVCNNGRTGKATCNFLPGSGYVAGCTAGFSFYPGDAGCSLTTSSSSSGCGIVVCPLVVGCIVNPNTCNCDCTGSSSSSGGGSTSSSSSGVISENPICNGSNISCTGGDTPVCNNGRTGKATCNFLPGSGYVAGCTVGFSFYPGDAGCSVISSSSSSSSSSSGGQDVCKCPNGLSWNGTNCASVKLICTLEYQPVCGCDGMTYGNGCLANDAGVKQYTTGECAGSNCKCPDGFRYEVDKCIFGTSSCILQYSPVCGCDGNTYTNSCAANNEGIKTYTNGECKTSGIPFCNGNNIFCTNALEPKCPSGKIGRAECKLFSGGGYIPGCATNYSFYPDEVDCK